MSERTVDELVRYCEAQIVEYRKLIDSSPGWPFRPRAALREARGSIEALEDVITAARSPFLPLPRSWEWRP